MTEIPTYSTPTVEQLRKKFLGKTQNEEAGLDDGFFAIVRERCETDPKFREMLKASMDAWFDAAAHNSIVVNGKVCIVDRDGNIVTIQG